MSRQKPPFSFTGEGRKSQKLTLKQRLFCKKYVALRGNGVAAARAAGYSTSSYNVLHAIASENLQKPTLLDYIQILLKEEGLTDESVDRELLLVVRQDADLMAKMRGISEYNKIRGRHAPKEVKGEVIVIEKGWRVEKDDRDKD